MSPLSSSEKKKLHILFLVPKNPIAGTRSITNNNKGVEDFSEEELRLPVDDDEGSSAISEQDYLRADDVPKDRDVSAANKVI